MFNKICNHKIQSFETNFFPIYFSFSDYILMLSPLVSVSKSTILIKMLFHLFILKRSFDPSTRGKTSTSQILHQTSKLLNSANYSCRNETLLSKDNCTWCMFRITYISIVLCSILLAPHMSYEVLNFYEYFIATLLMSILCFLSLVLFLRVFKLSTTIFNFFQRSRNVFKASKF